MMCELFQTNHLKRTSAERPEGTGDEATNAWGENVNSGEESYQHPGRHQKLHKEKGILSSHTGMAGCSQSSKLVMLKDVPKIQQLGGAFLMDDRSVLVTADKRAPGCSRQDAFVVKPDQRLINETS